MQDLNQAANALATIGGPRVDVNELSPASQSVVVSSSGQSGYARLKGMGVMFGDTPRRKVLCSCGAIAEFDSAMASRKKGLGKVVECRACRNRRIAEEMDALAALYNGEDAQEDDI